MKTIYTLPFAVLISLAACKTAVKSYNKGNYADAVELGVRKVQKDPSDAETVVLVKDAYAYAVAQHEGAIRALAGNTGDRYEDILREYNRLQDLYNAINSSPVLAKAIRPTNYGSYVQTYRDKVADGYLEAAERWMAEGSKPAARKAYYEFGNALRYRDNPVIRTKRDEAYNAALTKILVVPIRNYGAYSYHSDYQLQQFQANVMRTLANKMNDGFVRFYNDWDLQASRVQPDEILEMNLGRVVIGRPYDRQSRRTATKQVVVKETVYRPDSVVKQYANVQAVITTTQRTSVSQGDLYITLRDVQGRILWQDRFTGEHRWQTEFATYTGDDRALTDSDRAQLNQTNNQTPPREDDVMRELYNRIENDLWQRLQGYFSRF